VPPEFDQSPTFVPGNGAGVRFKEAEDLLLRGDFLALQDSAARLRNHPFHQREYPFSLTTQSCCLPLALLAECRHHTCRLLHHVLCDLHELLVQLLLLRLFVFPLAPQLTMQLLCYPFGRAQA
jgi:hypothetical protein